MSLTGAQLLTGLSRFIGDETDPVGLTTSAAGDSGGTSLVDDTLGEYDDDELVNRWVRITQSGSTQYQVRRIVKNESVSGLVEVRPAFSAQIATATTYELHRYDPRLKFTVLDAARIEAYPDLKQSVYDDTICGDGRSESFDIPSTIRRGPHFVLLEQPQAVDVNWNFLTDPHGDATTNYTATSLTATTVDRAENDVEVPKHESTCTKFTVAGSTNGTYDQTVGNMTNSITAALAAGRTMTYARWVYCRTSGRVTLEIVDDTGDVAASDAHQGRGWELLTVEGGISPTNSTTLTARLDVSNAAAAIVGFTEHGWFYFGSKERVLDCYAGDQPKRPRRDDSTQKVYLGFVPPRGTQVRLIGDDYLSALGTVASTQVTNTMEVDESSANVLYATALRVLFRRLRLNLNDFPELRDRVDAAELLRREMGEFRYEAVARPPMRGMWL